MWLFLYNQQFHQQFLIGKSPVTIFFIKKGKIKGVEIIIIIVIFSSVSLNV